MHLLQKCNKITLLHYLKQDSKDWEFMFINFFQLNLNIALNEKKLLIGKELNNCIININNI